MCARIKLSNIYVYAFVYYTVIIYYAYLFLINERKRSSLRLCTFIIYIILYRPDDETVAAASRRILYKRAWGRAEEKNGGENDGRPQFMIFITKPRVRSYSYSLFIPPVFLILPNGRSRTSPPSVCFHCRIYCARRMLRRGPAAAVAEFV